MGVLMLIVHLFFLVTTSACHDGNNLCQPKDGKSKWEMNSRSDRKIEERWGEEESKGKETKYVLRNQRLILSFRKGVGAG